MGYSLPCHHQTTHYEHVAQDKSWKLRSSFYYVHQSSVARELSLCAGAYTTSDNNLHVQKSGLATRAKL